ncbi:uncharacterized protein LOC121413862 isoform X1 [Lytechinus variegatus]|uniref:uncharacterized protein LOC121413862 isoform X1 n=1 Tax=Lytechinus variegatus TaxID=7654 RepID=UPI001BB218B4|nr:uncharacterized protein LOC121413862 isoform X1 [Lytechinus variegatus]
MADVADGIKERKYYFDENSEFGTDYTGYKLSSLLSQLQPHYDVIVIGSGYGGSIAASRCARAGKTVCVLERGKEWWPGDFPETLVEAAKNTQITQKDSGILETGKPTDLYDIIMGPEVTVVQGCGLGGTSLINANVGLDADPEVFEDKAWPQNLRDDVLNLNGADRDHVVSMLRPMKYPDSHPSLPKEAAMKKIAEGLLTDIEDLATKEIYKKLPLYVNFKKTKKNHIGLPQPACVGCGNCCSGCNTGAKNTLNMNYLPDAKAHGAYMFTEVQVKSIRRDESSGRWLVYYVPLGQDDFNEEERTVSAETVILGAGSLGSTNILLQSAFYGLSLSPRLGEGFTTNGDALNFSYNGTDKIRPVGIALEDMAKKPKKGPGPCITGFLDMRRHLNGMPLEDGFVLEDGTPPSLLELPYKVLMKTSIGEDMSPCENELTEFLHSITGTAFKNTLAFLSMSHDSSTGRMRHDPANGRVWIDFPNIGEERNFQKIYDAARSATKVLKGEVIANPTWGGVIPKLKGTRGVVTVHPLGGCCMAESGKQGVVDHSGHVFKGDSAETYPGLLVVDGAVMPRSLGVNPTLTISMVAERCMRLLAESNGWTINYEFGKPLEKKPKSECKPGLKFTERMVGDLTVDGFPYPAEFTLTIESHDIEHMLEVDPEHKAAIHGTVTCKALHDKPLTVSNGVFHLFRNSDEHVETKEMTYDMNLHGGDKFYVFKGVKTVHKDSAVEIGMSDTTTLTIKVSEGPKPGLKEIGEGKLEMKFSDFMKQLSTLEVTCCCSKRLRMKWKAKFGSFFTGILVDSYGVFDPYGLSSPFSPDSEPRKRRPLNLNGITPQVYHFLATDGTPLVFTRYKGGDKGPILLLHGLGVTHRIFALDTVEVSLVEFLVKHGFDVWGLEIRFSIALQAHKKGSFISDPADKDIPPAVDFMLKVTGAPNIQVFAHCAGSATMHASLLGGHLTGKIRSMVVSQVGFRFIVSRFNKLKANARLPKFLQCIGVKGMSAYSDIEDAWHRKFMNRVFDGISNITSESREQCDSDVCHRITFIYSLLWIHQNMNPSTHDTLHEWNGYVHSDIFKHFAHCTRQGFLDRIEDDAEPYLPDFHCPERLNSEAYRKQMKHLDIPILYFSGQDNHCWDPETTKQSYERCKEANPDQDYEWFMVPDYGHLDCIVGKDASDDVFPRFLPFLEKYAKPLEKS